MKSFSEIVDYAAGWHKVSVVGFYVEELFNVLKNEGIDLWQIQKTEPCTATFKIYSFSLEKVLNLAQSTQTLRQMRVTVCESHSLLEDMLKYKLRLGAFTGILFASLLFLFMTSFIWEIEISGVHSFPEELLLADLERNGLFVGALTTGHDIRQVRYSIMHDRDDIAFLTINIRGCKAEIEVVERVIPPGLPDPEPCNVTARCDGQIVFMETYKGVPQVKEYEAVRRGDLLVSGVYDSKVIGYRLVHADAQIMARTRRTYTEFYPFTVTENEPTGESEKRYSLKLWGLSLDLSFFKRIKYAQYETFTEEKDLSLGKNTLLPISFVTTTLYEYEEKEVLYGEEEALAQAEALLSEKLRIDLHGIEVECSEKKVETSAEGITVIYDLTVIEDICEERKIEVEIID